MNMKKTIAAIAAGAVAVSAMATTVSALESTTLHYNLYTQKDVWTEGTVQISGTVADVKGGADIVVGFDNLAAMNTYKVTKLEVLVKDSAGGAGTKKFEFATAWGADNWYCWEDDLNDAAKMDTKVTIPAESLASTTVADTASYDITVTAYCRHPHAEWASSSTAVKTGIDAAGVVVTAAGTTNETSVAAYKEPTKETRMYPLETTIAGADVTARLAAVGYVNATAVLNDAIENFDSVVFTFNTAAAGIKTDDNGAYYNGDWDADTTYTAFSQHLYNNFYNPEATGYLGLDWTGVNLFQGALVVNEGLTMSLADTDYFDWNEKSISFDWDAIEDNALTTNDYATFIRTLKLATSTKWYWDSMDVALTVGAEEDGVDAEAGVEADDEELSEEEVEEEVIEEVEEEAEEEVEVEVEVSNPTTGNASVALAVIPVALAAAAVVAKKRS